MFHVSTYVCTYVIHICINTSCHVTVINIYFLVSIYHFFSCKVSNALLPFYLIKYQNFFLLPNWDMVTMDNLPPFLSPLSLPLVTKVLSSNSFLKSTLFIFILYECLPTYICVPCAWSACKSQKSVSDTLELESAVRHYVCV